MNKYKKRLILLLSIETILILFHKMNGVKVKIDGLISISNWTYLLGMALGIYIVFYALRLGCKNCGARSVFRGFSIFQLRWPENYCHKCGKQID